ncbi:MAG TPA: tRNA (N6-isopentenyl adenosine(37)-C2)-methylthiotransferase MiaB [Hyphomicrobiaceae bacterium]|jgi:tRNA-2-methylthio-N6-dimethylallyladenosine synthase
MTAAAKVYVRTFGCQMNVYDSERMAELLGRHGFAQTAALEEADLIVLNTCHIREKAAEKVYSDLGRIRQIKAARAEAGRQTLIAVAGCVAQAEGDEVLRRAPFVDLVVGPQSYHRLGDLLARAKSERRGIIDTGFPEEDKFAHLPQRSPPRAVTAFLSVQEGCDKFCSFCVVPYTRGAEFSRKVSNLEAEARRLSEHGVREITLLGQNVNAYHGLGPDGRPWSLARLIARLAGLSDLKRIRYTTSHPQDMTEDLIGAHRHEAKLMPYLHLPFQAGADRILAAMNRKHTAADYLSLVARIRAARPDLALSTDIIVGFPGETEADFAATLAVVAQVGFAQAYAFKFSPRPGTPAATLRDQVEDSAKIDRLQRLQDLLGRQQTAFNAACVGRTLPVLFTGEGRHPGQLVGRSPYLQAVHATADSSWIGAIGEVAIVGAGRNSLSGMLKSAEGPKG